jgi:hypothetical protein
LSESLTDTLVDRGDQNVMRAVAENGGAKLSRKGLATLAAKARDSIDLLEALQKRSDVPPEVRRMWTGKAAQKAAVQPKAAASADMRRIEGALAQLAESMADPSQRAPRDISSAVAHMAKLSRGKPIDEVRVTSWIKTGRIEDVLAAIAHSARVPGPVVSKAFEFPAYEPLLLAVRAARYNWNTFKLLLSQKTKGPAPADVVKTSFEIFQQVPIDTAVEMLNGVRPAAPEAAA